MKQLPVLTLKRGKEDSLRRFHLWVFSGAVASMPEGIEEGDVVEVRSASGDVLGVGHYQIGSIVVNLIKTALKPGTAAEQNHSQHTETELPGHTNPRDMLPEAPRPRTEAGFPRDAAFCCQPFPSFLISFPVLIFSFFHPMFPFPRSHFQPRLPGISTNIAACLPDTSAIFAACLPNSTLP